MNIYLATYKFKGGGEYVPEDPVAGGGFYPDRYVENFIVARTAAAVRRAVKNVYPTAIITKIKLAGPA